MGQQELRWEILVTTVVVMISLALSLGGYGAAQTTLDYATALKDHPVHFLTMLTAEEKGFWKGQGLEVKWIAFRNAGLMLRAVAAGSVSTGHVGAPVLLQAASRGIPVVMVGELQRRDHMALWVRQEGGIRSPQQLKGARLGISSLGGLDYAFAKFVLRSLALEKETKLTAAGGIPESMALLRAGSLDAVVRSKYTMTPFILKGEVRLVVDIEEFLPRDWATHMIFGRKDFVEKNPDTMGRVVRALLQATRFIRENPAWSIDKIRATSGLPEEGARRQFELMDFNPEGRINRKGVENVLKFLVDYGIISREKAPPVDQVITLRFTG